MANLNQNALETMPCRYGMMSFFKNDNILSRSLREYGEWAQAEIDFLLYFIGSRDTVLDIGAFIGTHTLAFAQKVSGGGTVYAFEPQPTFFEVLKMNIKQNGLKNVKAFNAAASEKIGRIQIGETDLHTVHNFGGNPVLAVGSTPSEMREQGWRLSGVDVSARRIEWMRQNFPPQFQVYTGSILPILPFESNSFDVIYGLSVFTHMKFLWDMWLLELRRVLKPGGLLIQSIHTENAWNFFVQHGHEDWVRNALGPVIIDQKQLPDDFVYFGNVGESQVFWKRETAIAFWERYLKDVRVFPPPEKYWYQDWIVGRKAERGEPTGPEALVEATADLNRAHGSVVQLEQTSPSTNNDFATPGVVANEGIATFKVDQDFSQYGEQRIILDLFSHCARGFNEYCVDAGAYDGIVGSNSHALFLNGWRGLVIEPNPRVFVRLRALYADRPDIMCVQIALADRRQENVVMRFSTGPAGTVEEDKWKYAQVSTLHDAFAASYEKGLGYVYETSTTRTDTLTNVLHQAQAPKDMGFLCIDCEGEDLKIVRELDLEAFRPRLICVEADENSRPLFANIIEPRGYALHAYTVANAFFRLKD